MDISILIGEDGSGKDIGIGMTDGGKADMEGTMIGVADLLKDGTVTTMEIEEIAAIDNAR
jgi:hypothetical protein